MIKKSIYNGLAGCIATMHNKEQVIAPIFSKQINLTLRRSDIDTDQLGTFSGELPRTGTMLETAVKKASMGMENENLSIGIASEGSFGPHPVAFIFPAGNECIVFVDKKNNIVISESLLTEKTNFSHIILNKPQISDTFLKKALFPSHGLIVSYEDNDKTMITQKGICSYEELKKAIKASYKQSPNGQVSIQTDMRAHMNPTRMESIELITQKLVDRIVSTCPSCNCPGFGKITLERGLACSWCAMPTDQVKHTIAHCIGCSFCQIVSNKKVKKYADPSQCSYCNP